MQKDDRWTKDVRKTVTSVKIRLTDLSIKVRTDQFNLFRKIIKPTAKDDILDVGVSSQGLLKDSNMFEKLYRPQNKIIAATIEDAKAFKKTFPKVNVKKVFPKKKLPFKNKQFDIVVSWATLEHVGGYKDQEFFLNELIRVGKKVFVTTPYRGCIYEPHTGIPFLHWLPLRIFRIFCRPFETKNFWATKETLNPLYIRDIRKMNLSVQPNIIIYKMYQFLPSHILLYIN